jgi:hypothetical protein
VALELGLTVRHSNCLSEAKKLKVSLPFLTLWQLYINDDNLYQLTKTMNFFDILNAEEVRVVTDNINTKVVTGDERAVILVYRNCDRQTSQSGVLVSCETGVYVKISIAEFSHVLSPSQKKSPGIRRLSDAKQS